MMASFPEGEFHGTKARQKQNRAKSIRVCKEEPSEMKTLQWKTMLIGRSRYLEAFKKGCFRSFERWFDHTS